MALPSLLLSLIISLLLLLLLLLLSLLSLIIRLFLMRWSASSAVRRLAAAASPRRDGFESAFGLSTSSSLSLFLFSAAFARKDDAGECSTCINWFCESDS